MKRILAVGLCVLLAATSLFAQGGSETKSPTLIDGHEPVVLTIWQTSRNTDDFTDAQEKAFLAEHPWITLNKVIKEGDPGNEFYQAVAAGTAPDLINGSFTMMDMYISTGIVEPLNDYLANWDDAKNIDQAYMDMFSRDGKYYGVPLEVLPMLFGYNKALFEAAGLDHAPRTWDEALEFARILDDDENKVCGYATLAAEWTEWFFQYYVWQAGGDLTVQNEDGTIELTFTDPAVIEAAKFYQALAGENLLQSDRTLKFGDLLEQFSMGKIAMMPFATDWVMDMANRGMDLDDLGLALPPAGPSGKSATAIAGTCYVINAKTTQAKKDAAWEYISWYLSGEQRAAYYENAASKGAIAPVTIPRTDMAITDFVEFPAEYTEVLAGVGDIGRLEFYGKATFGAYVDRAVQKILSNPTADPMKEFAEVQKQAEAEALDNFNATNKR